MQKSTQLTLPLALSKILVALFAAIIVCGLYAPLAFADDPDTEAVGSFELQADDDKASGYWGTCPWRIDADYTLWVYPGESPDCGTQDFVPSWYESGLRDSIKKAVFVKQGDSMVVDRGITENLGSIPLFQNMKNLEEVDLTGLDVSHMVHDPNLAEVFSGCASLTSVDLSPLDTSSIEDMRSMFLGCSSLTSVNMSTLNLSSLRVAERMFEGCSSLADIDLSSFDGAPLTSIARMFYGCSSLDLLDLSSFNVSGVIYTSWAFEGCTSLKTVYVGDGWNLDASEGTGMFEGCTMLEGGSGTLYDSSHVGDGYARIDTPDTPGYLTRKGVSFRDLNYSFSNSYEGFGYPKNYVIPLARYELLFGSKRAKLFQQSDGSWGGSCYGMSSSSSMMNNAGSGILASGFNERADLPRQLANKDTNSSIGLNLTAFIEVMQVSQHADSYAQAFYDNAGVQRVFNYVSEQVSAGRPTIVGVFSTPSGGGGHAILAYGLEPAADGGWQILVYDNNWPTHGRSIYVSSDLNHWSYELWEGMTYTDGRLVYFPYDTYADVWDGRVSGKTSGVTNVLSTNSRNFEIYNAAGKLVATVEDGVLQEGAGDGVWQHHTMRATEDNIGDEQEVVLTLPNGLARVENKDASVSKLETSVSDQEQIASVETSSNSVELVVDDSTASTVAMVSPGSGSYVITLESALPQAKGKEVVEVSGKLTSSGVSVGMEGGALDTSSAAGATIKINGKTQDGDTPKDSGKVTGIADGKTAVVNGATYKVKSNKAGTAYYHKAPKSKKSVTIPAKVTINNKSYKVVGISKNAFKGTKAKTVIVKSAKLVKKSVKGCFKGAKKLKTVKVKVGSKAANKKALNKYKKYFTKKNAGKKVKLK